MTTPSILNFYLIGQFAWITPGQDSSAFFFLGYLGHSAQKEDLHHVITDRPPDDWRKPVRCPRTTWLRTVKLHKLGYVSIVQHLVWLKQQICFQWRIVCLLSFLVIVKRCADSVNTKHTPSSKCHTHSVWVKNTRCQHIHVIVKCCDNTIHTVNIFT